jgi:hypothetical protein
MAEQLLSGYSASLYSAATVTANATQAFALPQGDSYAFIADVGTITGTSPTFDICIQLSPDGGTTWYDWWRFAQFTAAAVRRLVVQPVQGRGEAGTEAAIGTAGTGGALSNNAPAVNNFSSLVMRVKVTVGGTSPSAATIKVWLVAQPRATAV